jgi:hypothetical protein
MIQCGPFFILVNIFAIILPKFRLT